MIRIKPFKCGYGGAKGYTCDGIPSLTSGHMFDKNQVVRTTGGIDVTVADLDWEFNQLPTRVKGMVYTEDTMDMSWDGPEHPEVAELTCRENTDPFSDATTDISVHPDYLPTNYNGSVYNYPVFGGTSAWSDLFNSGYMLSGSTHYFYQAYPNPDPDTSHDVPYVNENHDVYLYVTEDPTHKHYKIANTSHIPSFKQITPEGTVELEMGPGLLEPMLDTDFDPIHIDQIPAWEAGDDSQIVFNQLINTWKGVVDDRFRNIYWRLNNLPIPSGIDENLLDLIDQDNSGNECPTFQITLTGGTALQSVGSFTENTYEVAYGTLPINGVDIHLLPLSGLTFHFEEDDTIIYIWLTVDEDEEPISGEPYTAAVVTDSEEPEADHVYLIGGVAKIVGGTDNDSYVLFKIFQEDCITEVVFDRGAPSNGLLGVIKSGEEEGEVIVELPGSTDTPAPGILQPAVNIWLNDPRSESTTDVPTVEAVYNFVHGITAYNGPVADAKATEKSVSNTEGSTVYSQVTAGSVITITKDRADQNTQETLYNLQTADTQLQAAQADYNTAETNYNTAKSNYDSAKAAWEAAGSPSSGAEYDAYQAAQTALSTAETALGTATTALATKQAAYDTAYGNVYGAVTAGTPGTVFTINGIIISDSSILGGSSSVPTAYGVWTFAHGIYALATVGSVNTSVTPHTHSQGTPGTVFTIDVLDKELYDDGKYLQDEVPTVKAVMDYVQNEQTVDAVPGILIDGNTTEEWYDTTPVETPVTGIVNVSQLIVKGTTPGISLSAVPSVQAVYDFVHGTTADVHYRALATAGTISTTSTTTGTGNNAVTTVTGTTFTGGEPGTVEVSANIVDYNGGSETGCVPTADAVVKYVHTQLIGSTAGYLVEGVMGETLIGAIPGMASVARNICVADIIADRSGCIVAIPTVEAIYNFIHGVTTYQGISDPLDTSPALATPAAMTASTTAPTLAGATPGTVYVADSIEVDSTGTITAGNCVPTAQAVVTYVAIHGGTGGGGYNGPFKVNSDGTVEGGDVYFAGASICTAAKRTTALTAGQTAWVVVTKNGLIYGATIGTASSNTATTVSYPVAKNVSGTMTQLHYGALNITGRWM